jgi:hypothetical protein
MRGVSVFVGMIGCLWAAMALSSESRTQQNFILRVSACGAIGVSGDPQLLILGPGAAAGETAGAEDASTALRYTSAVGRGQRRAIVVQWENGNAAPAGCDLSLSALTRGNGSEGRGNGEITLGEHPQILISDIGSCATDPTAGGGIRLVYRLRVQDPARLTSGEAKSVSVIFTLMDAA